MRKKQIFVLLLITAFVSVSAIALFAPVTAKSSNLPVPLDTADVIGVSPEMMAKYEGTISTAAEDGTIEAPTSIGDPIEVGDDFMTLVSDWVYGYYWEEFVVIMEGEHGIICLPTDAIYDSATDEYVFNNPEWPTGGWNPEDRISTDQLAYLLDEFDNKIFPTVTEVFGMLDARGDEGTKVWVLIHNIRDWAYYDGAETTYIAGYFSSAENAFFDRNMFHIDTHDWINRVGPDGERPHLYEGTLAHEFEHMCHFDVDPDEPSWVDEGLADLASFLSGYGHSESHVAYYMVYHFWTPLTFWGGGLEDYGASYLFQLYLWEKYGGTEFISALVEEQANGIEGIENTLAAFGYAESFDEIFDDWTIANYLDDTSENPLYGYDTLTVGTIDSWGYSIEYALNDMHLGPPFEAPDGLYSSQLFGAPMPYTAHYYRFGGQPTLATLVAGDGYAGTPAYSGSYHWYSGMEAWGWKSFYQSFSIPLAGTTELNFRTSFAIETDWDYGYVEVFVHGANGDGEWYTLEVPGVTTSTLPNPQLNDNCPDDREPIAYEAASRWHAFTDFSAGYIPITMDLTPFAGEDIELYFTTWQDGAYTEQMMYVDDIEITNGVFVLDDVEAGEDGWTTNGWVRTTGLIPNNWQVTLIETLWAPTKRYPKDQNWHARSLLSETHMVMMDFGTFQEGEIVDIPATPISSRRNQVLIISNRVEGISAADYWVEFTNF